MLIDAHVHIDRYDDPLNRVLEQIADHNIFTVSTSMDIPSYERALDIGKSSDLVLPSFGVHPWNASLYADRLETLAPFIDQSPMIGEIGLDFHWVEDKSRYPDQLKVLEYFLSASREQNKIVNLHTKGAEKRICELLNHFEIGRAIVHWYSGPLDVFDDLVTMGVYFTVGVEVLVSEHTRDIARRLPSALLLTETDNPGGLRWVTGEQGMPLHLRDVLEETAKIRKASTEEIIRIVYDNFSCLIEDDPYLSGTLPEFRETKAPD
jgi:TatD DNase family protein